MAESMEAQIARLDERLNGFEKRLDERLTPIAATLTDIKTEMAAASESRRRIYEGQEKNGRDMIDIDHRLEALETAVKDIRPTTTELEKVRDRVIFAGSLGRALWSVGKALISAAAGAAAAWYTLTGRPPP